MQTTYETITNALKDALDLDENDQAWPVWRERTLRMLQRRAQKVVDSSDRHSWRRTSGVALTVLAGGITAADSVIVAPVDFQKFGEQGVIGWATSPFTQLAWMDPVDMDRARSTERRTGSRPMFYSVYGFDSETDAPFIYFYPFVNEGFVLEAAYLKKCPVLIDDADPDEPGGMDFFPDNVVDVIRLGLEDQLRKRNGGQAFEYSQEFDAAVRGLVSNQPQGQENIKRMGSRGLRRYGMH